MKTVPRFSIKLFLGTFFISIILTAGISAWAFNFPAAGWHRGDVSYAQENSRAAISKALNSRNPNFETDIIDFVDQNGKRVGLVSHDYHMKRTTGEHGAFSKRYEDVTKLPKNKANPNMPGEPFMTVIEL